MSDLQAIRNRHSAASPGPWHWEGCMRVNRFYLANWRPGTGLCTVMDFVRWGLGNAQPRFWIKGIMHKASEILTNLDHNSKPRAIDHPDMVFIAGAWQDINDLLAEVDRCKRIESAARVILDRVNEEDLIADAEICDEMEVIDEEVDPETDDPADWISTKVVNAYAELRLLGVLPPADAVEVVQVVFR